MSFASEDCKQTAADPMEFALWVSKYALDVSHEDDLGLVVPEDKMSLWGISEEERQADANELKVLRALGAIWFVQLVEGYDYCCTFKKQLAAETARRIAGVFDERLIVDIEQAFDLYIHELGKEKPTGFFLTYLQRVYPGNEVQGRILNSEIPTLRFDLCFKSHDLVCDGYSLLKFGMKYDQYAALVNFEKEKNKAG